ncbi:hypothetical protein ACFLQ8_01215 [Candidatus Auribacterota bacterium]
MRSGLNNRKSSKSGFTIIAILIFTLIVVVVSAITAIMVTPYPYKQLKGTARKLELDINVCRQMALCRDNAHAVVFDVPGDTYRISLVNKGKYADVRDPLTGEYPYEVSLPSGFFGKN